MVVDKFLKREDTFRYQLLSRLKSDCDYYLGNGNRFEDHLWAGDVEGHIESMQRLWDSFSENEKPEWLTQEDILEYQQQMQ